MRSSSSFADAFQEVGAALDDEAAYRDADCNHLTDSIRALASQPPPVVNVTLPPQPPPVVSVTPEITVNMPGLFVPEYDE
jgi:hypothetical protein